MTRRDVRRHGVPLTDALCQAAWLHGAEESARPATMLPVYVAWEHDKFLTVPKTSLGEAKHENADR